MESFLVAQSVERYVSNLRIVCSNLVPVDQFYFSLFCRIFICIFRANVIRFWNFSNRSCYKILRSFHPCKYCKVSHTTLTWSFFFYSIVWMFCATSNLDQIIIFTMLCPSKGVSLCHVILCIWISLAIKSCGYRARIGPQCPVLVQDDFCPLLKKGHIALHLSVGLSVGL